MNDQVTIRRSRGAVSGVALILLGLWGGLAPFVGPYFHFGYTPDHAWAYTTGRIVFSAAPGAAAVLGGLLVALTRSRWLGVAGGLLAALGGLWFIVGAGVTFYLLKRTSIGVGSPLGTPAGSGYSVKMYLEVLGLFGAVGALIIFFGALACGRLSMISVRDLDTTDQGYYSQYPAATPAPGEPAGQVPTASGQFPPASEFPADTEFPAASPYPATATDTFPGTAGNYPTAAGQFPAANTGPFPRPNTGPFTRPPTPPTAAPPFPDAPNPFSPDPSAQ
jgi:hypothetical protein